uniref:Uncharacterized protein n=1 Tax=Anopheles quadriannulatus TaxID=34691 RepID=A0A182XQT5_ANOQN
MAPSSFWEKGARLFFPQRKGKRVILGTCFFFNFLSRHLLIQTTQKCTHTHTYTHTHTQLNLSTQWRAFYTLFALLFFRMHSRSRLWFDD